MEYHSSHILAKMCEASQNLASRESCEQGQECHGALTSRPVRFMQILQIFKRIDQLLPDVAADLHRKSRKDPVGILQIWIIGVEEPKKVTKSAKGYHASQETLSPRIGTMPQAERSAAEEMGSDLLSGVEEEPLPEARYQTSLELERSPPGA